MVEPPVGRTRSRLWPKPQQLILELVRPNHTDGYWLPAPSVYAIQFPTATHTKSIYIRAYGLDIGLIDVGGRTAGK